MKAWVREKFRERDDRWRVARSATIRRKSSKERHVFPVAVILRLSEEERHMIAVGLSILRDDMIRRDKDMRLAKTIDALARRLKSKWYLDVVLKEKL